MNVADITDAELNRAILEAKGWRRVERLSGQGQRAFSWCGPSTSSEPCHSPPNHVTDANRTLELLWELHNDSCSVVICDAYVELETSYTFERIQSIEDFRRKVAEAWLTVFGKKT